MTTLKRIEARLRSPQVASQPREKISLTVEGTPDALKVLCNLLAAIEYNTGVGHSCTHAAFFDGDGADFLKFEGLPLNEGQAMAVASKPTELMLRHWAFCKANKRKLLPIHAIQHQAHSQQPVGYTQGWSISKQQAQRMLDAYVKEYPKVKVKLVVFDPQDWT